MKPHNASQSVISIRNDLNRLRDSGYTWNEIASERQYLGIPAGTLCRIAKTDYEPKDPHIRVQLHLPALAPAPVCVKCGQVHITKRCTANRLQPKRWADYPADVLRWKIEHRETY